VSTPRLDRRQIKESLRQLRQLERQHSGTPGAERLAALALLKAEPDLTIVQAAKRLGRSRRALQRWLGLYREGGIPELLSPTIRPGRPRRLGTTELAVLREEVENARLQELADVQDWLKERLGLEFSQSGVWYLMRRDLKAIPRGWVTIHDAADREKRESEPESGKGISHRVLAFLNALPITGDVTQWVLSFREALAAFFGDVDRVSINVNTNCNLSNPESYDASSIVTQHVGSNVAPRGRVAISVKREKETRPADRLLRDAEQAGFPVKEFHPPAAFDYHFAGTAYLGTIVLWRKRTESPISEDTLDAMAALEPFVLFALSDIVARHKAEQPVSAAFSEALSRMNNDAELSAQEQKIVILQLMGHSYKEMAELLSVTVDTVKKHFKQIHRKTATRSQSELFAKYFTFRIQV
jgi:transposase